MEKERRFENRFPVDEPVKVTVLSELSEPETVINGRIANLSARGMGLLLNDAVPVGALVRVDIDGTMLLGEVCYCSPGDAGYAAGLALEHAVTLSADLSRLMQRLLEESRKASQKAAHSTDSPFTP